MAQAFACRGPSSFFFVITTSLLVVLGVFYLTGMRKKNRETINKSRKPRKNNQKNQTVKKTD
jgi:hypothetical protein